MAGDREEPWRPVVMTLTSNRSTSNDYWPRSTSYYKVRALESGGMSSLIIVDDNQMNRDALSRRLGVKAMRCKWQKTANAP